MDTTKQLGLLHSCATPAQPHPVSFLTQDPLQVPKTEVALVFGGVIRSRVTCLACHAVSDKLDPFYDLSLDLHGCRSIIDALDKFTETDRLEGANLYCCEKCQR